jgi:hypothetical protein
MGKPAPLELSPPSEQEHPPRVFHDDIPWAEIIIEPDPDTSTGPWDGDASLWPEQAPPIPVLIGVAVVLAILLW